MYRSEKILNISQKPQIINDESDISLLNLSFESKNLNKEKKKVSKSFDKKKFPFILDDNLE